MNEKLIGSVIFPSFVFVLITVIYFKEFSYRQSEMVTFQMSVCQNALQVKYI